MDGLNQALLVSFFSAAAFTFGLPFVLQHFKYELGLAGQVYFGGKSKTVVLGKAALIFVGGGLLLAWVMLQLVHHFDGQLEFSSGESYRRADTYAWIARHWVFAFGMGGIIAFKLISDSVHHYVDKEVKKDDLKKAYGSKDWATREQIHKALPQAIGGRENKAMGAHIGDAFFWHGMGHWLTVGGSGQGKGIYLLLSALLSDTFVRAGWSSVILDPKGELAAVAAPHFKQRGYDVHVVNPMHIPEIEHLGNSRWNPFDQIDPTSNSAWKMYDVLAAALHADNSKEGGSGFFNGRCRQYISLYLAYAQHSGQANWETVYKWLSLSGEKRKTLLASMMDDETFDGASMAEAIRDRLMGDAAETEENIFGTVEKAINVLKDKDLRTSLSGSDFDMRTIAQKPTVIFVCIPFEELHDQAAWVRMFFNFMLRTLTRHYNPDRKVMVILDEFAQLSYMDEIVRSSTVLRGYNVTLWPIVQGLSQLKSIYKDQWEIFINNAVVTHWLSTGTDNMTAEYIAKRMPQALEFIGNNADGSPKEKERPLLNASEVIGCSDIICEISGLEVPAKFEKIPYWEWAFSKNNAAPNPFYRKSAKSFDQHSR